MSFRQLIGTVGSEPEATTITYRNGKHAGEQGELTKFRLAVKDAIGKDASTTWYGVTIFDEARGKAVQSEVYKGARVAVEGEATVRSYEGKDYNDIIAQGVALLQWLGGGRTADVGKPADDLAF